MAERWTPQEAGEWIRLGRDILCYMLGAFMILFGTLNAAELGVTILGALFGTAAVCLGLPAMLRIDRRDGDAR